MTLGAEKEDVAHHRGLAGGERFSRRWTILAILTYRVGPKEHELFQEIAALADANPSTSSFAKRTSNRSPGSPPGCSPSIEGMSAVIGTAGRLLEEPALRDR
ncbi:MAG: hypothetical protein U0793_16075 [Gemmataceae bacterium]